LSQDGANVVFFLDAGGATRALLQEAAQRQWLPAIFLLGSLAGAEIFEIPGSFTDKVFLAFPTLPSDQTRAGVMEYRTLMDKHKLPARHLVAQLSTYASAKVLVEGLKRAGKELSREKLIATLEGLYEFDTGVTPRITYGPNRRIGAVGAYVVGVDVEKKAFIPLRPWMTLE
jgi:ABC-type branched-subunit amino acid transport system substrate-binding protein